MVNLIYSQGALDDLRSLSNSILTDTCSIYPAGSSNSSPVMTNRGGVSQASALKFLNIPCRVDVNPAVLMPQKSTAGIESEKLLRYLYISLQSLTDIGYIPESGDTIVVTGVSNPLGNTTRYTVLEADMETDGIDCQILIETTE